MISYVINSNLVIMASSIFDSMSSLRPEGGIFFRRPLEATPFPPGVYESFWVTNTEGGLFYFLPDFEALCEIDALTFGMGGAVAFLYSYISRDISYGTYYVWPCSNDLGENMVPVERITALITQGAMAVGKYIGRFTIGGIAYHLMRTIVHWTFQRGLGIVGVQHSQFRLMWLSSSLYTCLITSRFCRVRPAYKLFGGLWIGLLMALTDSAWSQFCSIHD